MRAKAVGLWVLVGCYWVALFTLTHLPLDQIVQGPAGADKVYHFVAYFTLAALLGAALSHLMPSRRRLVPLIVFVVAAAYGALDETTQPLVGRFCEFADWVADASGAAAASVLLYLAHVLSARRPTRPDAPDRAAAVESA